MNNMTGIVINIRKLFPGDNDVSFMQFLLKQQLLLKQTAVYYVFKNQETVIGYASMRPSLIDDKDKILEVFVSGEFESSGIIKEMISFAVSDNPEQSFLIDIESSSASIIQTLEALGFRIVATTKKYIATENDLHDKLPSSNLSSLSKLNKNLLKEFEKEFLLQLQQEYSFQENEQFNENLSTQLRKVYDYKNSYAYIKDNKIQGWLLCENTFSSSIKIKKVFSKLLDEDFSIFLKDCINNIFKNYITITFSIQDKDKEMKKLLQLFGLKATFVIYTYSNKQ